MNRTLRQKLSVSYLVISMITLLLIGIFINGILEKQFKSYILDNINSEKNQIAAVLKSHYTKAGGKWDVSAIDDLGAGALSSGYIIRVKDINGNVLWDALKHNEGFCVQMLQKMAANMNDKYGRFKGGYTESDYPIIVNNIAVGSVTIGYYGPYFYSDNDLAFLKTLNKLLLIATLIIGVLSIILGTYTAKRLSGPITRVIKKAEKISEGDYNGKISEVSDTREIIELTDAINTLADRLGNQESLRKRLTADVAHELRTPIANLQSHLEAIIDGVWKPDTERLKSCHEETVRLTKIVSDLESLAKYENEMLKLMKEKFDVSACMRKTLKSFESEFINKNIELKTNFSSQVIQADQDKITQVFFNIISNAIKYTPEKGKVEVTVSGHENEAVIEVRDNGIGISEEDLPYIFERFYRADKSRSRATGGSGIGLAIAKSLVNAHGGQITVTSEYAKGSDFVIFLPK